MTLPSGLNERLFQSFVEDDAGNVAVRATGSVSGAGGPPSNLNERLMSRYVENAAGDVTIRAYIKDA